MKPSGSVRRLLLAAVLFPVTLTLGAPKKFDIPAQPAGAALQLFGKQAAVDVTYPAPALKEVRSSEVKGEMEPGAALDQLLAGTGFTAQQSGAGRYVVSKVEAAKFGSVEGTVQEEKSGRAVIGARIAVAGTGRSVLTDKRGRFALDEVAPGEQVIMILAEGLQDTKVTDVKVQAGRRLSLGPIGVPIRQEGALQLEPYAVSAKKNDGVVELDPYAVEGRKEKPFTTNMDIPRTVNDVQPYYIIDSKTIDASGASTVDDLLKQKLTMNAVAMTNGQTYNSSTVSGGVSTGGNTSIVNLRGLGTDKTLILINGRRQSSVSIVDGSSSNSQQVDLNGIPLAAIERIEVLPTSASGIYGGSALGGVVNIVLKQSYSGTEVKMRYENAFDTDASARRVSLTHGQNFDNGRMNLLLSVAWADSTPMLLGDRNGYIQQAIARVNANNLAANYVSSIPFLGGSTTNIRASSTSAATLTLKDGTILPSNRTFVPVGTSPATPSAQFYAGLATNAGQQNYSMPDTNSAFGRRKAFGWESDLRSFNASMDRKISDHMTLFANVSYSKNSVEGDYNPIQSTLFSVPAAATTNPFNSSVYIYYPLQYSTPVVSASTNWSVTVGANIQLPSDWHLETDYTRSENHFKNSNHFLSTTAFNTAIASGILNPFIDTVLYPLDVSGYIGLNAQDVYSALDDVSVRAAGTVGHLPWGTPRFNAGAEYQIAGNPTNTSSSRVPGLGLSSVTSYFKRRQETASVYAETLVPLVPENRIPLVKGFEAQVAGRIDQNTVDTGTASRATNLVTGAFSYSGPTLNGAPYFSKAKYSANSFTSGVKLETVQNLTFRSSFSTAFLPPTPAQLIRNPVPNTSTTNITDSQLGGILYPVQTISGGNPDLSPQDSKSVNVGLLWMPEAQMLRGLRLNLEYYWIRQFNAIGSLTAQQIVGLASTYPDRITRDPSSGRIALVDTSNLNLFLRSSEGFDLSLDYGRGTQFGAFTAQFQGSFINHLKEQVSLTSPKTERVGFPFSGGSTKLKANLSVGWEKDGWQLLWSVRYFGGYQQSPTTVYLAGQGGNTIDAQSYHDLVIGKSLADLSNSRSSAAFYNVWSGMKLQLGVSNMFNQSPPLDVAYSASNYYASPYGDLLFRRYWLSLAKRF